MKQFAIVLAVVVLGRAGDAAAGAWTQPKGSGFFKIDTQLVRGKNFREVNGSKITIPTLADYTASLYGEYGLRADLTAIGISPSRRGSISSTITTLFYKTPRSTR